MRLQGASRPIRADHYFHYCSLVFERALRTPARSEVCRVCILTQHEVSLYRNGVHSGRSRCANSRSIATTAGSASLTPKLASISAIIRASRGKSLLPALIVLDVESDAIGTPMVSVGCDIVWTMSRQRQCALVKASFQLVSVQNARLPFSS